MDISKKYSQNKIVEVLKAYLYESKSHRQIQSEILKMDAPPRGGGFEAMIILHHYGISGDKKGILANSDIDEQYLHAKDNYKRGLDLIRRYTQG
ncbi:hypothetical protein [Lentibacillus sediminis]|uniref:hypothetical protein n=1 Tax=Lentibacillus sediminis TaxID=1940529 RepID=UPI000C1C6EA5|nr:hypothetical protein [Lentibacillus sediminis]